MKETDLLISNEGQLHKVKVTGRANFDYAVPLRELGKSLEKNFQDVHVDLSDCITMDSTFMGVLSMLGLKARSAGGKVVLSGAREQVRNLLHGLGIERLFTFVDSAPLTSGNQWADLVPFGSKKRDALKTAETVLEAHEVLVEADASNQEQFEKVIDFAREDLERLKEAEAGKTE